MFLEFLTDAYKNACTEGEVVIYRAHVATVVLGDLDTVNDFLLRELLHNPYKIKGLKMALIKSKFNKTTHKTEEWRQSQINSSEAMTEFKNAVLSHIRSRQHGGEVKGEKESHCSVPQESEQKKSSENRIQDVKIETTQKERVDQFNKMKHYSFSTKMYNFRRSQKTLFHIQSICGTMIAGMNLVPRISYS